MKIGDKVCYLADPYLFGVGTFFECTSDGMLVVEFEDGTVERFRAIELDTVDRAYLTTGCRP